MRKYAVNLIIKDEPVEDETWMDENDIRDMIDHLDLPAGVSVEILSVSELK